LESIKEWISERRSGWAIVGWGIVGAGALLWPSRLSGPLDGIPLDTTGKALVLGIVLPVLWWFHSQFLATRFARACILALIAWKAVTAAALVQDGWCVRFVPSAPLTKDAGGAPHSWDVRADWRAADPSCSAIMRRPYGQLSEFPVWFFNLPPADDNLPTATDRPPGATMAMTVRGFLRPRAPGRLQIITSPDVAATVGIDGAIVRPKGGPSHEAANDGMTLTPLAHAVMVGARLTGDRWQFMPQWNGSDLWAGPWPGPMATLAKPSRVDVAVRPWGNWVVPLLVAALMLGWLASVFKRIHDLSILGWATGASCCAAAVSATASTALMPWSVAALALAVFVPVPSRLRNIFGAFVLIGVPWLTLIAALTAPGIGRFTMYTAGDDWWTFQRYAYRIFLQGYWLEGGQHTFWFQPLYRWVAGSLHVIFGDSSVGEWYWDGACLLATALFSFHVTKVFAGFRWGLVAAVTTLFVIANGRPWGFIGRGLSEITSAGLIYLAALFALRSRDGSLHAAIAAGVLATLAFYTRLNNLPMVFAVCLFALPVAQPIRDIWRPSVLWQHASLRTFAAVVGTVCVGMVVFAVRTWHYTGVFSVFYGTTLYRNALWQPGVSIGALAERMASSALMTLTMNDPPRLEPDAIPLLLGAAVSVLALTGLGRLGALPLVAVLFCLAALAGSLVARGEAYAGRFSIHMIAVTTTIVVCTAAQWCLPYFFRNTSNRTRRARSSRS
jgi:hypothetical protein